MLHVQYLWSNQSKNTAPSDCTFFLCYMYERSDYCDVDAVFFFKKKDFVRGFVGRCTKWKRQKTPYRVCSHVLAQVLFLHQNVESWSSTLMRARTAGVRVSEDLGSSASPTSLCELLTAVKVCIPSQLFFVFFFRLFSPMRFLPECTHCWYHWVSTRYF